MKRLIVVLALALGVPLSAGAQAQKFPTKPVRIIVPFVPGGASDILARLISAPLKDQWGQPVIVENKTGAGGTIGTDAVVKAAPDGHTLVLSDLGTMTIMPSLDEEHAVRPAQGPRAGHRAHLLAVPRRGDAEACRRSRSRSWSRTRRRTRAS